MERTVLLHVDAGQAAPPGEYGKAEEAGAAASGGGQMGLWWTLGEDYSFLIYLWQEDEGLRFERVLYVLS